METKMRLREDAYRTHHALRKKQEAIATLHKQIQALEENAAASITHEKEAIEALARSECKELCETVMTRLPRELRDMIYQHILTERESQRIDREYFRSTMDPVTKLHTYDSLRWKALHHAEHTWDTAYVGQAFYTELAATYYRHTTFVFSDDKGLIARFLEKDFLGLGFAPKDLVSSVEIRLGAVLYDNVSCMGYMFGKAAKPEQLLQSLEGVEGLRKGARIRVRFETALGEAKAKEGEALEALSGKLRELGRMGYVVGLEVDGETRHLES